MSERLVYTTNLKANPNRLFAIWFLLILLPVIILGFVTDRIFKVGEAMIREKTEANMLQELESFRDDLSPARFVQHSLSNLPANVGRGTLDAGQLANLIEHDAGLKVCAAFVLKAKTNQFSVEINESVKAETGLISRTIIKSYLTQLIKNSQPEYLPTSARRQDNNSKTITRGRAFLRNIFTTAGQLSLEPGKVQPALSGREGLGRLLFYFRTFNHTDNLAPGGAILVFRERDIQLQQLLSFASSNKVFADLTRTYAIDPTEKLPVYRISKQLTRFVDEEDGSISVSSLSSQEHLLKVSCEDSFFPSKLDEVLANIPLTKVIVHKNRLQHPLRESFSQLKMPGLVIFLAISILFLRIYLFGYGHNISIRLRLLSAVAGAAILPFSTFIAAITYQTSFQQEFDHAELQQYVQLQAEQISRALVAQLNAKELQIAALSKKLGQFTGNIAPYLKQWLKDNSAAVAYYETEAGKQIIKRDSLAKLDAFERDIAGLTMKSMREALKPYSTETSSDLLGLLKFKAKGLGIVLENTGKLHNTITGNLDRLYAIFPIFGDNLRNMAPVAVLFIKFFSNDIINDFLQANPWLSKNEIRENYQIQRAFIPLVVANELPPDYSFKTTPKFQTATILQQAGKVARSRSTANWVDTRSINTAVFLQQPNCILIIRAQKLSDGHMTTIPLHLPFVAYFMLLVFTVVFVLNKVLVEPISLLKNASAKIAAGDFEHHISFSSGDEFEPLTKSFNQMTDGLRQKELLASYVSATVMQEISANTGLSLSPGGERIEVSVLFCSLAGFKDASSKSNPVAVTTVLSRLIDTVDSVAAANNGVMDKLIEDTAMLVFRQTPGGSDHVFDACRAALQISAQFPQPDCPFHTNIGIASGTAVSGKIGSAEGKLDFTVIGNPVNLAARLKAQAGKAKTTGIVVCPSTIRLLKGKARLGFIEHTEIRGRSRTFPLYELLEMR